ncbi:MAG: thiol reductase thioredoxin [Candidatus Latescibacteria bacterium]|nr:thiol reductase thioredoxin [Candidatus Latescibacterota bacterium]NIO57365.1 thiol reductase thioredoxin [Candidatus Latescibacterota bacterium]
MAVIALNEDNFESTVLNGGIALVDCWAPWCAACKPFAPIYEKVAARYPENTFGKLDTRKEKSLVSALGVDHIPTLLLYREGILLFRQPGYFEEEQLEDIIRQAQSLDMDYVRAQIAAERDD